jgi:hypothetical protein
MALPKMVGWEAWEEIVNPSFHARPDDIIYIREDNGRWPEFSRFIKGYTVGHLFGLTIDIFISDEKIQFEMKIPVKDRNTGQPTIVQHAPWFPRHLLKTQREWEGFIRREILVLLSHEVDEQIRYNGTLIRDPHP